MNKLRKHSLSFKSAFAGIHSALITQVNLKIHFLAGFLALSLGYYLQISTLEYLVIIVTIGTVIVSEMANTALEHLADAVTLEHNEYIKMAKDVAAGSVLLTAIIAIVVGIVIFLPKLI